MKLYRTTVTHTAHHVQTSLDPLESYTSVPASQSGCVAPHVEIIRGYSMIQQARRPALMPRFQHYVTTYGSERTLVTASVNVMSESGNQAPLVVSIADSQQVATVIAATASFARLSPTKRHLDRFIRFRRAHGHDQHPHAQEHSICREQLASSTQHGAMRAKRSTHTHTHTHTHIYIYIYI